MIMMIMKNKICKAKKRPQLKAFGRLNSMIYIVTLGNQKFNQPQMSIVWRVRYSKLCCAFFFNFTQEFADNHKK